MKKLVVFIIAALTLVSLKGQTIVMEEDGGVYKIPCLVNGAKMKFIFDTGAATVSLSLPMAEYLYDNDYISTTDFIKVGQSIIADGSVVDHMEINLRNIEISGRHLSNVPAVVIASQNAPLLLGMSAIQKLGRIEINGNVLTIVSDKTTDSKKRIDELTGKIKSYQDNGLYGREQECWAELYTIQRFTDEMLFEYARCCYYNTDFKSALRVLEEIKDYETLDEAQDDYHYYTVIAGIYFANKKFRESAGYYSKALLNLTDDDSIETETQLLYLLGESYAYLGDYISAQYFCSTASEMMYLEESEIADRKKLKEYHSKDMYGTLEAGEESYRTDFIDRCDALSQFYSYKGNALSKRDLIQNLTKMSKNGNTHADVYLERVE